MYSVSNNFKTYIAMPDRTFDTKAIVGAVTYLNTSVIEFDIEDSVIASDDFSIGNVIPSKLVITIKTTDTIATNAKISPAVSLNGASGWTEWVPLGSYYIDSRTYQNDVWKFTCYDKLILTQQTYVSSLTYPVAMSDVMTEIAGQLGVTLDVSVVINPAYEIPYKDEDITIRDMISYIASAHASSVKMTKDEKLAFVKFVPNATQTSILASDYFKASQTNPIKTYTKILLTYNTDGETLESGTGDEDHTLKLYNPFMDQTILDSALATINGFNYTPFNMDWKGRPDLEVGDAVLVTQRDSTTFNSTILTNKMSFKGGLKSIMTAPSYAAQRSEFNYKGSLSKQVANAVKFDKPYYGVTHSRDYGIKIVKSDGSSEAIFNSDDFKMTVGEDIVFEVSAEGLYLLGPLIRDILRIGTPATVGDLNTSCHINTNEEALRLQAHVPGNYLAYADDGGLGFYIGDNLLWWIKPDGTTNLHSSGEGGEEESEYILPEDWIDIDNCITGNINLLVADSGLATYAFICTTSSGQYLIDWGDGATSYVDSGVTTQHTYTVGTGQACSRGYTTFKIIISPVSGTLTSFKVTRHSLPSSGISQIHHILACVCGATGLTTLANAFYATAASGVFCTLLEWFKCSELLLSCLSSTYMFYNCRSLQSVDVSGLVGVTDASYMFQGCVSLQRADIRAMVSITGAISMFNLCYGLQVANISGLTSLTDATWMFYSCFSLQSIDVSDLTGLEIAQQMFSNCHCLQSIDISGLTGLVSVAQMFNGCSSLHNIDISNLTSMSYASGMFLGCSTLQSVNVSSLTGLADATQMFYGCTSLRSIDISNLTNLTNANQMFSGCSSLHSIDVSNLVNVTNTAYMFAYCYSLQSINMSNLTQVTNSSYMFQNCCSLNLLVAANFAASVSGLNAENMFYSCQQLSSIDLSSAKITKLGARGPNATAMGALETLLVHPSSTFGGTLPQLDIRYNTLTAGQLDAIFTALPTVASKTVDITGCPGANTCDKLIATSKGWLVTG